jgi:zinc protease
MMGVLCLVLAGPGAAQEIPPALDRPPPAVLKVTEGALPNGLRFIVTEDRSVPWVAVQILVSGGAASDPADRGGAADLVARTIFQGTATRSSDEIADTLASLGAIVTASAGPDWITMGVSAISPFAAEAIGVVADVIRNPSFPIAGLESSRTVALGAAAGRWAEPRSMAGRVLRRSLYGPEHPYGRDDAINGLAEALVTDLRAYHAAEFAPETLLVSLVGDVGAADAERWLTSSFGDWVGRQVQTAGEGEAALGPPSPEAERVFLVHVPGATRGVIRLGQTIGATSSEDWLALEVAHQILGGVGASRLARRLAADSIAGSVFSNLTRQVGSSLFQVGIEVPAETTDRAIGAVLDEISRFLVEGPSEEELQRAKLRLAGSIPLQRENPDQVARQLASIRLLGGSWQEWASAPEAILRLGVDDIRAAARRYLTPSDMKVAVVGDATILRSRVAALGDLRIEDAEGQALGLADLTPAASTMAWETRGLLTGTWEYRIMVEDAEVGSLVRTVDTMRVSGEKAFVMRSVMITGEQRLIQSATFTAAEFRPLKASFSLLRPEASAGAEVSIVDAVLRGTRTLPGGRRETFEALMVKGALVGEMLEAALWILPHEPGYGVMLPVMQVQSGASARIGVGVAGRNRVVVPAGSFDAYLVEIAGEQGVQVAWVSVRSPHVVLRLASPGRPEILELVRGPTAPGR